LTLKVSGGRAGSRPASVFRRISLVGGLSV
jgi:hypothetical protein